MGLNASGFTVEEPWQARSIVDWRTVNLARAKSGDKFISLPAEMLLKLLLVGLF